MMGDPDILRLTYRVAWSPEDQEFVATCDEFPSLSWLEPTAVGALVGLQRIVYDTLTDMNQTSQKP